jgi:hypothetical protein
MVGDLPARSAASFAAPWPDGRLMTTPAGEDRVRLGVADPFA